MRWGFDIVAVADCGVCGRLIGLPTLDTPATCGPCGTWALQFMLRQFMRAEANNVRRMHGN